MWNARLAQQRLKKDLQELAGLRDVCVEHSGGKHILTYVATGGHPSHGGPRPPRGTYRFVIRVPDRYPFDPPHWVWLEQPDAAHPALGPGGVVSLDVLMRWSPASTLMSVLLAMFPGLEGAERMSLLTRHLHTQQVRRHTGNAHAHIVLDLLVGCLMRRGDVEAIRGVAVTCRAGAAAARALLDTLRLRGKAVDLSITGLQFPNLSSLVLKGCKLTVPPLHASLRTDPALLSSLRSLSVVTCDTPLLPPAGLLFALTPLKALTALALETRPTHAWSLLCGRDGATPPRRLLEGDACFDAVLQRPEPVDPAPGGCCVWCAIGRLTQLHSLSVRARLSNAPLITDDLPWASIELLAATLAASAFQPGALPGLRGLRHLDIGLRVDCPRRLAQPKFEDWFADESGGGVRLVLEPIGYRQLGLEPWTLPPLPALTSLVLAFMPLSLHQLEGTADEQAVWAGLRSLKLEHPLLEDSPWMVAAHLLDRVSGVSDVAVACLEPFFGAAQEALDIINELRNHADDRADLPLQLVAHVRRQHLHWLERRGGGGGDERPLRLERLRAHAMVARGHALGLSTLRGYERLPQLTSLTASGVSQLPVLVHVTHLHLPSFSLQQLYYLEDKLPSLRRVSGVHMANKGLHMSSAERFVHAQSIAQLLTPLTNLEEVEFDPLHNGKGGLRAPELAAMRAILGGGVDIVAAQQLSAPAAAALTHHPHIAFSPHFFPGGPEDAEASSPGCSPPPRTAPACQPPFGSAGGPAPPRKIQPALPPAARTPVAASGAAAAAASAAAGAAARRLLRSRAAPLQLQQARDAAAATRSSHAAAVGASREGDAGPAEQPRGRISIVALPKCSTCGTAHRLLAQVNCHASPQFNQFGPHMLQLSYCPSCRVWVAGVVATVVDVTAQRALHSICTDTCLAVAEDCALPGHLPHGPSHGAAASGVRRGPSQWLVQQVSQALDLDGADAATGDMPVDAMYLVWVPHWSLDVPRVADASGRQLGLADAEPLSCRDAPCRLPLAPEVLLGGAAGAAATPVPACPLCCNEMRQMLVLPCLVGCAGGGGVAKLAVGPWSDQAQQLHVFTCRLHPLQVAIHPRTTL